MKVICLVLLAVTSLGGWCRAESDLPSSVSSPRTECRIDADCDCRISPDHCGYLPTSKLTPHEAAGASPGENRPPACFGPKYYVTPACVGHTCICRNIGKAPD